MIDFRERAITLGLRASWLLVAALVLVASRFGVISDRRLSTPTLLTAVALGALSFIPWSKALRTWRARLYVWLWLAVMVALLISAGTIPELRPTTLALSFAMVAISAAVADQFVHALVTLALLGGLIGTGLAEDLAPIQLTGPVIALFAVAVTVALVTKEFEAEARIADHRLKRLQAREADLERLYAVAQATANADTLEQGLPELVGRIGRYLRAELGALLLRSGEEPVLSVVSPIWTAGNALAVEGYHVPLHRSGLLQRVYLTSEPMRVDTAGESEDSLGLLAELGVRNALIVPLRVEERTLGLMVIADKEEGAFTDEDLETLASLAAPAALAIAQLERFEETAETSRKMEELARMKSDFVSVVSHELRTPLTSIIGALDTMARPQFVPDDPQVRELLDMARSQAQRLRRLIEDLLIVSRIEARGIPTIPERVDLQTLVAGVLSELRASERVDARIPAGLTVRSDPDHLRRILTNLIENAFKYAPGAPVEVVAGEDEGRVFIEVIDHGPGIPEDRRQQAFERFTQLDAADTRPASGAGLGLSIVRGLAGSIGGLIELRDTPGGGATFRVVIPRELQP